ncbi:MAG: N-acetylglucosamine-6-phosphate deacetylase [bacterium]
MQNGLLLKNCYLYSNPDYKTDILINNGKIAKFGKIEKFNGTIVEGNGLTALPGLIEVHIQGAGGADVLDNSEESLLTISNTLAKLGTTGFLATTVVKPTINNNHLKLTKKLFNKPLNGATILGVHLEGPFINVNRKGGIDSGSIYDSSLKKLLEILEATGDSLKMMTIAPELPGNIEIIEELVNRGIIASFAHSEANYEQTKTGFNSGISHVTHIFNAMNSMHHRQPGPIAAIIENGKIPCQIISDGHHLHPGIIKFLYNTIGIDNCICITDGVQAMGLPEGEYIYNGKKYISKAGAGRYYDGTLIGSTFSLLKIMQKFLEFTGCSLYEAVQTVSLNPAKLLKIDNRKGSLEIGKDADIILIDKDFNNYYTVIEGREVFNNICKK